jgi:hypothetical protein
MKHPRGNYQLIKIYEYARDNHLFTDEDKFLDSITERQDLYINMTLLETDAILGAIRGGPGNLNSRIFPV